MSDPLFSVADQIVIISGGSRGIGKAIAQGFAVRGAHTVITGREADSLNTTANEITEAGSVHEVTSVVCDVAKSDNIQALIQVVLEIFLVIQVA